MVPAWSRLRRVDLSIEGVQPLGPRRASFIGAPDLRLFPAAFAARSVRFRAGLELSVMHLGLSALSWLVRARLLSQLTPLSGLLHRMASLLERFGSDRGGMRVAVSGLDAQLRRVRREWTLIAEAGAGPEIPAIPAFVMIGLLRRQATASGARACIDAPALAEIEAALPAATMRTERIEVAAPVLYERVLGAAFARLPEPLRELHAVVDEAVFAGRARIDVGKHRLARWIGRLMRFPAAADDIAVEVTMRVEGEGERWSRRFGGARFHSVLRSAMPGTCVERFGLLSFDLQLVADERGLAMPLRQGRFIGLPLPRGLMPESRTREFLDEYGRACFDVEVLLPRIGRVIRYRGFLEPVRDDPAVVPTL